VNNWPDYGGMDQYVEWSQSAAAHDDFYTDPLCKEWYRAHVARVLTRINTFTAKAYRDDPAIFAWELANEPRAPARGRAALDAWIAEMASYLKQIDSTHLLSTGSEGFYSPGRAGNPAEAPWMAAQGVDFISNHAPESIDVASFHTWPDNWSLAGDPEV